jgi:hypothetical protein
MHKVSKKPKSVSGKIKGRALEVYLDLCRKVDQFQGEGTLPSIRKLQRQYAASQKTITTALKHLSETRPILRQPRRKARFCPAIEEQPEQMPWIAQHRMVTTLGLSCSVAANWQPVIDRFNEKSRRMIKPHYVETLEELVDLCQHEKVDFALFHCNPISNGALNNTLAFINLQELAKTLRTESFYPGLLLHDPQRRCWGIAALMSTSSVFVNRNLGHIPCSDYTWEELIPYLRDIKKKNSDMLYPLGLNGYSTFLMHNGVSMLDQSNPEKLCLNNNEFAEALVLLKGMLDEGIAPLFSETYYDLSSLRWFESGQIAAREIFLSAVKRFKGFFPDYDLLPMPAKRGEKREVYSEFFSICASSINYGTAWDFIKFTLSRPVQEFLVKNITNMPVRRHLAPEYLTQEQFAVFDKVLENSCSRLEDYYLPTQIRLIIETGVDRWIKFGGKLEDFLIDLERSCQQRLEHLRTHGK